MSSSRGVITWGMCLDEFNDDFYLESLWRVFNWKILYILETADQMVLKIMPHCGQVIICIIIYLYMNMIWFRVKGDVT